jgi:hypothetical protein
MNYQKIHDSIVNRAKTRILSSKQYTENHHLLPKCEGGNDDGETVLLTHKEHKIVHKLRYKITNNIGNLLAYNFMSDNEQSRKNNNIIAAKLGAKAYHTKFKNKNPEKYSLSQSKSGKSGGKRCAKEQLGLFKLSESERMKYRLKGTKTVVENKLGMFSEEFREKHRLSLMKRIKTSDGIFNSIGDAAKYYNVTLGTITYRLKNEKWFEWNYLNNEGV